MKTWFPSAGLRAALMAAIVALAPVLAPAPARADIPDELYAVLGLDKGVAPNVLYDALVARYRDPAQGAGEGQFADLWEPIPFSIYMNPASFYEGPPDQDFEAQRTDCVACHENITPGWVHSWKGSVHGNLDEIRALGEGDSRFYKVAMISEVEGNLRSMGLLAEGQPLAEVGCIDCHIGVGAEKGNHRTDLRMPDAATCGQCHVQQFAERESERDTLTWPQDQWPAGRPSHALSYLANVETAIWVGMGQREVAEGFVILHLRALFALGLLRPEAFPVVQRDFAFSPSSHDMAREVKTFAASEKLASYAIERAGDELLRAWFLPEVRQKSMLIGQLLPFSTARLAMTPGANIAFQTGGYWVYRLAPVETGS